MVEKYTARYLVNSGNGKDGVVLASDYAALEAGRDLFERACNENAQVIIDQQRQIAALEARCREIEAALREAYQISHYGRGTMQDIDDVLERAIRRSTSAAT